MCLASLFKKENKELLTYLLFESGQEEHFRSTIKNELEDSFQQINKSNIYLIKKSLRKILRFLDKVIRFSGKKETEIELRIYFLQMLKEHKIPTRRSRVLGNMYEGQLKKIKASMEKIHEDLQYDFKLMLEEIGIHE